MVKFSIGPGQLTEPIFSSLIGSFQWAIALAVRPRSLFLIRRLGRRCSLCLRGPDRLRFGRMVVNVSDDLAGALRKRAQNEGRDIGSLVEEAVREYLISSAITDLSPEQIGEAQLALLPELNAPPYETSAEGRHEAG